MIDLNIYKNKNIGLLGLGISGIACGEALLHSGANIMAWDDNEESRLNANAKKIPIIDLKSADFSTVDFLLISPGISDEHPIAQLAIKNNIPLIGEVKLLADNLPNNTYIGITGTNGKSTTTALLSHLLDIANITHATGGNLGVPATALPTLNGGVYILEMSSYMLERLDGMHFNIGVFLNLSTDHLERHKTMDGYLNAKTHLFDNMTNKDTAIVCMDDIYGQRVVDKIIDDKSSPKKPSVVQISYNNETKDYPYLSGNHNRQNIACIRAVAHCLNIPDTAVEKAFTTFTGLAHRQEFVDCINGVNFINDSKATNAKSSAKALSTYDNIYWIAGGQEKGGYEDLIPYLSHITKAYLIGDGADNIRIFLSRHNIDSVDCHTMDIAVKNSYNDADSNSCASSNPQSKGTVVLSPACASWDQYKSFEHRGEDFRMQVSSLKSMQVSSLKKKKD